MVRPARSPPRARASASPSAAGASRSIDGGTQRLPRIVGLGRALDLILTGRIVDAAEALRDGAGDRGRRAAGATSSARCEIAEGLARFPQETMLADRRAALAALGLPLEEGLALEAQRRARDVYADAARGARRFAGGEGRGAAGAGV